MGLGTENNQSLGSELQLSDDMADAIAKKHTQNTDTVLATMLTKAIWVDNGRTDTYTPTGTFTKPYLTPQAALTANATEGITIAVMPGNYANTTINFTANNQTVVGIGTYTSCAIINTDSNIVNVGNYTNCKIMNFALVITAPTIIRYNIVVNTGECLFESCILTTTYNDSVPLQAIEQGAIGHLTGALGTLSFKDCLISYENNVAFATSIKTPFVIEEDCDLSFEGTLVSVDCTAATQVVALARYADAGIVGNIYAVRSTFDTDSVLGTYVIGNGYIIGVGTQDEEYEDCIFNVNRSDNGNIASDVAGLYASSAAAASVVARNCKIDVFNNSIHVNGYAYSYYQAGISTIDCYLNKVEAVDGIFGTVTYVHSVDDGNFAVSGGITGGTVTSNGNVNVGGQGYTGVFALTDAATIATDCNQSNIFSVTLGGNRILGAPTNMQAGSTYIWIITQNGSRTLDVSNAVFKFPGGIEPTLTVAGAGTYIDILTAVCYDGTNFLCSMLKNFS